MLIQLTILKFYGNEALGPLQVKIRNINYTVNELNSLLTASYTWNINDEWALDALTVMNLLIKRQNTNMRIA